MVAQGVHFFCQVRQLTGMGGVVVDHILHQSQGLLHGIAAGAGVALVGAVVVVGVLRRMALGIVAVGMLAIGVGMDVGMLVGVGYAAVGMLMAVGMGVLLLVVQTEKG